MVRLSPADQQRLEECQAGYRHDDGRPYAAAEVLRMGLARLHKNLTRRAE